MNLITNLFLVSTLTLTFIPQSTTSIVLEAPKPPIKQELTSSSTIVAYIKTEALKRNIEPTPEQAQIILEKSKKYGIDPIILTNVIRCESGFNSYVQSKYTYPDGTREQSFGIAQWHLPAKNTKQDGSVITKEDALNQEVSIDIMAWYFSQGKQTKWTCYTKLYGKI